ncbi:MAG: hypothetical protein ACRCY8_05535 [Dermatophilaceae bacterium]
MIVDANVLRSAVDEQSHLQATARAWLEPTTNGVERVGLPWLSLMASQRSITHPRVTTSPTDAHLAALAIEHGTGVCSFDSDFGRFDGLHWISPDRR